MAETIHVSCCDYCLPWLFPAGFKPAPGPPLTFSFESGSIRLSVLLRIDKGKLILVTTRMKTAKKATTKSKRQIHKNHQQQNNLVYFTLFGRDRQTMVQQTNLACHSFLWTKFYRNTVTFTIYILFIIGFSQLQQNGALAKEIIWCSSLK